MSVSVASHSLGGIIPQGHAGSLQTKGDKKEQSKTHSLQFPVACFILASTVGGALFGFPPPYSVAPLALPPPLQASLHLSPTLSTFSLTPPLNLRNQPAMWGLELPPKYCVVCSVCVNVSRLLAESYRYVVVTTL